MARKAKVAEPLPLPKLPFSMCDRAAYINKPWVAVARMGREYLAALYYSFANGMVHVAAVGVAEIDSGRSGHGGIKQFYVDGFHAGFGPTGQAQANLQWLKSRALQGGATPDAIRYMASALKLTKKEEETMAKAATAKKATKTDKPVGKGGKLAKAGNAEGLAKAHEASAARKAALHGSKLTVLVTSKDLKADTFKLRGGRLAKLQAVIDAKPKTVGDAIGLTGKDGEGVEHTVDMGALRGMEKREHVKIG